MVSCVCVLCREPLHVGAGVLLGLNLFFSLANVTVFVCLCLCLLGGGLLRLWPYCTPRHGVSTTWNRSACF